MEDKSPHRWSHWRFHGSLLVYLWKLSGQLQHWLINEGPQILTLTHISLLKMCLEKNPSACFSDVPSQFPHELKWSMTHIDKVTQKGMLPSEALLWNSTYDEMGNRLFFFLSPRTQFQFLVLLMLHRCLSCDSKTPEKLLDCAKNTSQDLISFLLLCQKKKTLHISQV